LETPEVLRETEIPKLETVLPKRKELKINNSRSTLIYNFYNLDPFWKKDKETNRILLLEPSHFEKYSVSSKTMDFVLELAKNIGGIQIYVGEFDELVNEFDLSEIYFKEHPTTKNYKGIQDERDWLFPEVKGYFPSFFKYWKQSKKFIRRETLFG
jgi:deoxyribodipyrimidine photo-lyase